ncbi:MAG: sulfotransferase family protein [archaeon]
MKNRKKNNYFFSLLGSLFPILRKYSTKINVHPDSLLKRIVYNKNYNYMYFRIPKCANSTIVKTLCYYDKNVIFKEKSYLGYHKNQLKSNKFKLLLLNKFPKNKFKFTFVRNPYSRVLSAYLDKIINPNHDKSITKIRNKIKRKYIKNKNSKIQFSDFITYLEKEGLYDNFHWAPQSDLIPKDIKNINFVGKVENINKDLKFCIKKVFGKEKAKKFKIKNANSHKTNSSEKFAKYYTPDLQKRVYKLYKNDFQKFKYKK